MTILDEGISMGSTGGASPVAASVDFASIAAAFLRDGAFVALFSPSASVAFSVDCAGSVALACFSAISTSRLKTSCFTLLSNGRSFSPKRPAGTAATRSASSPSEKTMTEAPFFRAAAVARSASAEEKRPA